MELITGNMELITDPAGKGSHNMDYDMLLTEKAKNEGGEYFRLYSWSPWCLSLGFNQDDADVDKQACAVKGYDIVRRPTGGRAVFHADELTYSYAGRLADGVTARDVYRDIHLMLVEAISDLGMKPDYKKSQPDFRSLYKEEAAMSRSCFASAARYEIEYEGKKIVGSAQRVFGDILLQHGSILLGPAHLEIADLMANADTGAKDKLKNYLSKKSISLSEIAGREISKEMLIESIAECLKEKGHISKEQV